MKNIAKILQIMLRTGNPAKAKSLEVTEKIIFPDTTEQITAGDCGLAYCGVVTTVDDATNFKVATLTGFGDHFFKNYYVYVVRDAGGVAPQDELQPISVYASADGTFTHTAFSVGLAEGDEVLILHKYIAFVDVIKLKSDLINSDSGSATITGTDSDTIVPASLPTKMHLSLDINALIAAAADNTIEIKVGAAASERVVAYYKLVGDAVDVTADTGSGIATLIKQKRIDISNILVYTGEQVIISNTVNVGGNLAIPYNYICGV